jgi:hypothetical protein
MKKTLCGLALVSALSAAAVAQAAPAQLNDAQMDTVNAGFRLFETDISNTSWTQVGIYTALPRACTSCYLSLTSMSFNVASNFGPVPTLGAP